MIGASEAAKLGAVATLIRSVTPFSMSTLHTGWQDYDDDVTQIPTASITKEDARMFQRLQVVTPPSLAKPPQIILVFTGQRRYHNFKAQFELY